MANPREPGLKADGRQQMSGSLQLDFGNLPLVEAAVRASFASSVDLTFRTINSIHERIREDFPTLDEPSQLEVAPGVESNVVLGPGKISGALFANSQRGLTITVQNQVVVARWQKRLLGDPVEYPRYQVLRDALWQGIEALEASCSVESIPVAVVNMSYVNFIIVDEPKNVLRDYFSQSGQLGAVAKASVLHKVEAS